VYSKTAVVRHGAGLHARPATIFVQKANCFAARITICKDGKTVDAKSILKLLTLGVVQGNSVLISGEGLDEKDAVETLVALVESGEE
jgi:phosphocarrier protein HPr